MAEIIYDSNTQELHIETDTGLTSVTVSNLSVEQIKQLAADSSDGVGMVDVSDEDVSVNAY